jgi:hypothetical protein
MSVAQRGLYRCCRGLEIESRGLWPQLQATARRAQYEPLGHPSWKRRCSAPSSAYRATVWFLRPRLWEAGICLAEILDAEFYKAGMF